MLIEELTNTVDVAKIEIDVQRRSAAATIDGWDELRIADDPR